MRERAALRFCGSGDISQGVWQKLLDPDSLKILVPVFVGFFAACIGFASAFTVAFVNHFLSQRAVVNKLRISRGYALAEKISKEVERIETSYRYFEEFWKGNYGHVADFKDAIQNFDSKQVLFQQQYQEIRAQAEQRHKLGALLLGAWLYLPGAVVDAVQAYLKVGEFSYHDDAAGFINEYHERFFENLLDPQNSVKRRKAYDGTVKRLRRLKL